MDFAIVWNNMHSEILDQYHFLQTSQFFLNVGIWNQVLINIIPLWSECILKADTFNIIELCNWRSIYMEAILNSVIFKFNTFSEFVRIETFKQTLM